MQLGTILLIVTIVTGLGIIIITPLTKKISKNYYFWFFNGLFVFLYVFFGRQLQYLMPNFTNNINVSQSISLSRIFLLDLCPFYAIFGSLTLFLKNKNLSKIMAPFGLFGALVTIFGQIVSEANSVLPNNYWQYIFIGDNLNQLYFMMHFLSFILSLMIICWLRGWKIILFGYMHVFAFVYFGYILFILSVVPTITSNTTGILENDWINGGEYFGVQQFLGVHNYPLVMIIGYILSYISIAIIFFIRYGFEKLFIFLNKKFNLKIENFVKNKWFCKTWNKLFK
ncbi:DUF5378 family protein [Mycoplasmoides alvi]|uniref:DUF5378 family protein n=1 Tax=Mycoplasmoides alvi TaxID=78580 RepID=UPI000697D8EB|nr:DUF5378 family protein [Mycoplasmoides alvi]